MNKPLKVTLENKGSVTLKPSDHIATGGEGSIYKVGDCAVKIYLNPDQQRKMGMPDKIKLLSGIKYPSIVSPTGLVFDSGSEVIGHYLPFVDKGHALSLVFTNDFWSKNNFTPKSASELVEDMREVVYFAHKNKALLVDANELNWFALLNSKIESRVIDVDSWSIGKWPASVIMPSIRDWNSSTFDEKSDWFAWACVTFQIYTGIHPYKGTLDGFSRGDLIGRMKAKASVFTSGVKVNAAVRDFKSIPLPLRNWYESVFQGDERGTPPSPLGGSVYTPEVTKTSRAVVSSTDLLVFNKLLSPSYGEIIKVFHCGLALTSKGEVIELNSKRVLGNFGPDCEVVRCDKGWLAVNSNSLYFVSESGSITELSYTVSYRSYMSYENRLFLITEKGLSEVKINSFGSSPILSIPQTWNVLINSTSWFSGFGVMDAMGAKFLIIPFGKDSVINVRVKELDEVTVISGKSGNRFVSLVYLDKKGIYTKLELSFDKDYALEPKLWSSVTDSADVNIAILPKGVCATIVKDGELDIFIPSNGNAKKIKDGQLKTDMTLYNWADTVVMLQSGEVWSVKLT